MREDKEGSHKAIKSERSLNYERNPRSLISNCYSDYLTLQKPVKVSLSPLQREMQESRNLQNLRLARKLSQIKQRKSIFEFQQALHYRVYNLKMNTKKNLRQLREKHLQEENDILISRILKMRSHKFSLFPSPNNEEPHKSQRHRKKRSGPIKLPQLEDTTFEIDV